MQVQYIVDFDVRQAGGATSAGAYAALLAHVQTWLEYAHLDVPDLAALPAEGSCELRRRDDDTSDAAWSATAGPRRLSWRRTGTAEHYAARIDLRAPLPGAHAVHVTGVTLAADLRRDSAALRVVTGRESTEGRLAPAPLAYLRRPAVVRRVVQDEDLRVTALGRRVDGLRTDVTTPAEAEVLVEALDQRDRLPVVLVAPTEQRHLDCADAAALELPGLATVVAVRSAGARAHLAARRPQLDLPRGAARLVWPDLDAFEHPLVEPEHLASRSIPVLVDQLVRAIAPLSVIARGIDLPYRSAERAERAEARAAVAERLAAAEALGDGRATIDALHQQVAGLERENEQWMAEVHRLEEEVAALTAEIGRTGRPAADVRTRSGEDWDAAPELDPDDAKPLLSFLEERTGGRLRFTTTAARTWRKSRFAHPPLMREALLKLGRASLAFAEGQGSIDAHLDDWFRDACGLDVAMTDLKLRQSGRARFEFEGSVLEGLPHVRLGDGKRARECGRIYFAHQSDPARFVVHHVGIHDL